MGLTAAVAIAAGGYVVADTVSAAATVRPTATCKASVLDHGTMTVSGLVTREPISSVSNPMVSTPPSTSGGGLVKTTLGPATVTASVDANTAKLLKQEVTGKLATITITLSNCRGVTEYTYTLTDAAIVGMTTSWRGAAQTESITISYAKLAETARGGTTFCFDSATQSTC
jgi:hypothetical protein